LKSNELPGWDLCYNFKNTFAQQSGKIWRFLLKITTSLGVHKINNSIDFQETRHFFNIGESSDHKIGPLVCSIL
jgi:hypothetical protein